MVTISLAGSCSLCTFFLNTGEKKLLISFIPDPVCFRCCFGSFSPGGLFWPSFSIATWFSGSRSRNEPKICSSLGSMYLFIYLFIYLLKLYLPLVNKIAFANKFQLYHKIK